jgi:HSP20 family protein
MKPLSNIFENKDNFKIELAIPGLKKENIKINLDKNVLSISSEIENENVEENNLYQRREFNYSSFESVFTLPKSADLENIQANFRDGMLEITITKSEEAKDKPARSIEIQ